ncbi:hypothetical protein GCM10027449_07280 [Sinomonas notoginsengisoli]
MPVDASDEWQHGAEPARDREHEFVIGKASPEAAERWDRDEEIPELERTEDEENGSMRLVHGNSLRQTTQQSVPAA